MTSTNNSQVLFDDEDRFEIRIPYQECYLRVRNLSSYYLHLSFNRITILILIEIRACFLNPLFHHLSRHLKLRVFLSFLKKLILLNWHYSSTSCQNLHFIRSPMEQKVTACNTLYLTFSVILLYIQFIISTTNYNLT